MVTRTACPWGKQWHTSSESACYLSRLRSASGPSLLPLLALRLGNRVELENLANSGASRGLYFSGGLVVASLAGESLRAG
ncbi:MAG: hypothetical protein K2Y37_22350, partial [Pirellulales bacterium]|nr:hypothetical protein [Pirellulales bacterium]